MKKFLVVAAIALMSIGLGGCPVGGPGGISVLSSVQNPVSVTNLYQGELLFEASLKTFNELKSLCANRALPPKCRTYVIKGQALIAKAGPADKAARDFITNNPTLSAATVVANFTSIVSGFQSVVGSLNATKS